MSQSQLITLSAYQTPEFRYFYSRQVTAYCGDHPEKPHIHDCYEIYVNISGDVAFLVNNRLYPVRRGDVIVSCPGDVHICVYQSAQPQECVCLWVDCPELSPLMAFTARVDFSHHIHFAGETRKELLRLLEQFEDARKADREPEKSACMFRILTLLQQQPGTDAESTALPAAMQQVLDYINRNFCQLRGMEEIADAAHISSATLNRWFRQYLQLSPHKYVEALKLAHAQKLLQEGCSVTEAADESGFGDCSRFIAVFKSKFGQTPLQYQKTKCAL